MQETGPCSENAEKLGGSACSPIAGTGFEAVGVRMDNGWLGLA